MDLIIGAEETVKFSVPSDVSAATFVVTQNNVASSPSNATVTDGIATCTIPYKYLDEAGSIEVTLTFSSGATQYTKTEYVDVIKPYLELFQLKALYANKTDAELVGLESVARNRINAYCGQDFYYEPDTTYNVISDGTSALQLPKRLIDLETINGQPADASYQIEDYIIVYGPEWIGIKEAPPDWALDTIIRYPYFDEYRYFDKNKVYAIKGDWGFKSVPSPVIDAMKTLIKHYSSRVAEMQETGIQSAKAADWSLTFGDSIAGRTDTTGNNHADTLLEDYRVTRLAVI